MSTKTTFKRIALVAVAALGFGMLSVVPSNAAAVDVWDITVAESIAAGGESAVQVAGFANYVTFAVGTANNAAANTNWTVKVSGAGAKIATAGANLTIASDSLSASTAVNSTVSANAASSFTVNTPTAGTVSVAVYQNVLAPSTGIWSNTLDETMTITVKATGTANVYSAADSTVYGSSAPGAAATSVTEAALAVTPASGSYTYDGTTEVFRVDTAQLDANGNALTSGFKTTVATITGAGTIGSATNTPIATVVASATQSSTFYVFADGRAGVGTLTISVGGAVAKTYSITFYGAPASFAVSATSANTQYTYNAQISTTQGIAASLGVGEQQWWSVKLVDAAGVTSVAAPAVTITIADTTILSDPGQAAGIVKVQGVKAGTTTFTVKDTATGLIVLGPVTVKVSNTTAASATFTLDKSDYVSGEAFTLTINAKDANGLPLADGTYASMASVASSTLTYTTAGTILSGAVSPSFVNGVATVKGFMPVVTGPVTFTATLGTTGVATAAQGAKLTATANVSSAAVDTAQAATDAAAEATDAANAATDAANAAAEAADAATAAAQDAADAVAALSTQVSEMVNALKKQITALTNLVIKIQKKVKA